ncbi:DNA-binding HxlR family transcriptional regulator [Bacillus tianshenii]|uniref:DNA-binding HxlR family transcriptional regulator n=1 Tax=Sutcliffiella tianshenii TaxID=1463404 RepID=A0ABS2NZH6_9BACI|nr:helix-turn-helix domain-containing protein [Bacillus tianshenii]MBM7620088.1 DNA-binding HxlR family transcriptional regulator [Bacillus tianshenii]
MENTNICPVDYVVDLISGKWKVLIIWNLKFGKKRFGQLQRILTGISKKVLSQHLKELENSGLIIRTVIPSIPVQVEYSLTERGMELSAILEEINQFGAILLKGPTVPKS